MELKLCFDTTFLIDLQRERGAGLAHEFLEENRNAIFFWSAVSVGEFAEGFSSITDPVLTGYLELATILEITKDTALVYAGLTRELRRKGKLIGANDLWIASHALQHSLPLVTADPAHFSRVPGLRLVRY